MRYFSISQSKMVGNAPRVVNWFKKINPQYLKQGSYYLIENRTILPVITDQDTVFTEIISYPFFMVSKKIKDIMSKYEPTMRYKEIILLDQKNEKMECYFLPILDEIDCIAEGTLWNPNKTEIKKGILEREKIGDSSIFILKGVDKRSIVVRLDLLESMLRRNAILDMQEFEVL